MDRQTNEQLAAAIQKGQTDLLPLLWEQTEKLIKMLIMRFIKNKRLPNSIDSEDLLQCGYFALLRAVKAYKPDERYKFNSYLEFHIRNVIRDELIHIGRIQEFSYNKTVSSSDDEIELIELMEDENAEESIYIHSELSDTQRIVIEALEELPPNIKEVIYLHYFKGLSYVDIAKLNGCSTSNANALGRNGLRILRKNRQLKKIYFEMCEHSFVSFKSYRFRYSPEYFEAIRKIEEIEKAEIKYLTYGKREARRRLIMLQAEQEYNNAQKAGTSISEKP